MNVSNFPIQPLHERYKARGDADFNYQNVGLVRLEISVGQPYHEGAKLQAAIDWAEKHFNRRVILLGDTLQRYNYMMEGIPACRARVLAKEAGDAWLTRHQELIEGTEVLRWDEVLNHPEFLSLRWKVGRIYRANRNIRNLVNSAIEDIAERRNIDEESKITFFDLSLQYVLEEATGTAIENTLYPGVSAYPGTIPRFWSALSNVPSYMTPKGLDNANCIRIRFKKK